jgi:prefoldin subunit 2
VLEAVKDLEGERRCWRMVGGVMVERTIGEITPTLRNKIDNEV